MSSVIILYSSVDPVAVLHFVISVTITNGYLGYRSKERHVLGSVVVNKLTMVHSPHG